MGMVLYLRRVDGPVPDDPDQFYDDYFFSEEAEASGDLIDFDKAWQGLHYLLSGAPYGTAGALGVLVGRGEPVGEDNGYGPPLLISADEMRAFNAALNELTDDDLARRFDPEAMARADVYMAEVFADEDGWDYLAQGIPSLRRFAQRCADNGSGAIALVS